MMPSVSVIVPTYNRARWLPEAVTSVLRQTHAPLEVLIVDDGSTDDTEAVCASFAAPVRYIRQANAGVSAARNHGVREARGEWIAFLDSDDVWLPAKLEIQLAALRAFPGAEWSVTGCEVVDLEGQPVPQPQGFERAFPIFAELGASADDVFSRAFACTDIECADASHRVYSGDPFQLLFRGNFALPSSVMVRREVFDAIGGFDETLRLAEETECFHRLAARSCVAVVMSPLVRYRVGGQGSLTSSTNTTRLIRNALTSLDRAARLRPELSPSEQRAYEAGRQSLLLRLAYTQLSVLEREAARATVAEVWRRGGGVGRTPRGLAIYAASLLPVALLRRLHSLKRGLRA